jgi:hypothetical protein
MPAIFNSTVAEQMAMELFEEAIQLEIPRSMAQLVATPATIR